MTKILPISSEYTFDFLYINKKTNKETKRFTFNESLNSYLRLRDLYLKNNAHCLAIRGVSHYSEVEAYKLIHRKGISTGSSYVRVKAEHV